LQSKHEELKSQTSANQKSNPTNTKQDHFNRGSVIPTATKKAKPDATLSCNHQRLISCRHGIARSLRAIGIDHNFVGRTCSLARERNFGLATQPRL
jgi:hypothetical protein